MTTNNRRFGIGNSSSVARMNAMRASSANSPLSQQMSRGQFLRTAGMVGGAVAAAGLGLGGVANATFPPVGPGEPNPNPTNIISDGLGGWIIYPTGNGNTDIGNNPITGTYMTRDTRNVQWAVNNTTGTVLLKHVPNNPFLFPQTVISGRFFIRTPAGGSCVITGETNPADKGSILPDGTDQFPNGTPLTTIQNGAGIIDLQGLANTLKNLRFSGIKAHVCRTFPPAVDVTIDNVWVDNLAKLAGYNPMICFWSDQLTGSWTVKNCKISHTDPATFGNLNEFAIGYNSASPGNGGANVNIINNTTILPGPAIGIWYNQQSGVKWNSLIANNHIIVSNPPPSGPKGIYIRSSKDTMICNNLIEGVANYGIQIQSISPVFFSSDNYICGNDLSGLISMTAQVHVDSSSQKNYFGLWTDPVTLQNYPNNTYGSLKLKYDTTTKALQTLGVFVVDGNSNSINLDDFTQSKLYNPDPPIGNGSLVGYVPGWNVDITYPGMITDQLGCIAVYGNGVNQGIGNQIFEHPRLGVKYFPPGTDLCGQVFYTSGNMIYQWDKLCTSGGLPSDKFNKIIQRLEYHAQFMAENEPPYGQAEGWPLEE